MIKILIVDDSETETAILKHIIQENADLEVIGCAKNGAEAVKLVALLKPDLITMDIQMPVMNGFEATRIIMAKNPTPIVVISSILNNRELNVSFEALDAGALDVLAKPRNITSPTYTIDRKRIVDTIRNMAEIKVIRRRTHVPNQKPPVPLIRKEIMGIHEIVAIGASIGGTQALNTILSKMPADFPVPIVIVQHMMPGFTSGFTKWLNNNTKLTVQEAKNNEILKKGNVYFAPDHYHFEIHRSNHQLISKLVCAPPISGFFPSITALLQSAAKVCGRNTIGLLLTGMGSDGAEGLLAIKQVHGHTIIQDKDSSVVFGMAGVAQSLGAAEKILPLDQIADYLIKTTT